MVLENDNSVRNYAALILWRRAKNIMTKLSAHCSEFFPFYYCKLSLIHLITDFEVIHGCLLTANGDFGITACK